MVQNEQITFYAYAASPYCHPVHIALEEAKADYASVDLKEKPEWYRLTANPVTGMIPALTYGGPKHPPEEPSTEAALLVESTVILEFLAETFPSANLLPRDALLRAQARMFISIIEDKLVSGFRQLFSAGAPTTNLLASVEALQNELGTYPAGEGKRTLEALHGPKFARIMEYVEDVKAQPSFQATWDEAAVLSYLKTYIKTKHEV